MAKCNQLTPLLFKGLTSSSPYVDGSDQLACKADDTPITDPFLPRDA